MKTLEAIQVFGSARKLAAALGISTQAVHQWGEDVPELRRFQIEEKINGRSVSSLG